MLGSTQLCEVFQSECARIRPAVDQYVLTVDEARMLTAQKRAGLTEFFRMAKAIGRGAGTASLRQFVHAFACFFSGGLQNTFQTVGVKRAGQQVVDGDIVFGNAWVARQAGDKAT